ncbi:LamG domain-containing protein [Lunatibacter salilacus]|uniref:LamG domain-containing protein n=1 Tax=Lunatibacter salilacus TaxID=2483804 RepID=UPI00131A71FA|nr:LamG domain-containing protein [Lunatibacter salilacus]
MFHIEKKTMLDYYSVISKIVFIALLTCACNEKQPVDLQEGLLGHWELKDNADDVSGKDQHAIVRGDINFNVPGPRGRNDAAEFSGKGAWLEVPIDQSPELGRGDFSVSLWVKLQDDGTGIPGDLLSQYDSLNQNGFHLSIKTNAVTTSLANYNQVHFGVNANKTSDWKDYGSPDSTLGAFSMTSFEGSLYAGLSHPDKDKSGNVFRLDSLGRWVDCGSPDGSNSVMALAVFNNELYAGTGKYRFGGSALPESENLTKGGRILRYGKNKKWIDNGELPNTEAIGGLITYKNTLYASSLYHPAGFFRLGQENKWVDCGTPDGKRVVALGVYDGYIYATSYDGGNVYRYDGQSWTDCGHLGENTQTYSFAVYYGQLYVGTWPSGRVYRFDGIDNWKDVGRLGSELEVMGMLVHNGRLLAGTLPLAEVYAYKGDTIWEKLTRLDHTPDVTYRRAWTMAENNGKLYCSTLPSGKIYGFELGRNVLSPTPLKNGWQHITAVKSENQLALYINGEKVAQSDSFEGGAFDLNARVPLRIGFGANSHFKGKMSDLRLYQRSLDQKEIKLLSNLTDY